jgi:glycosyltransferase involved in cell wall biosynthesis
MKIVFASRRPAYPFFWGGAERSFYELARVLAQVGHQVTMLGDVPMPPHDLPASLGAIDDKIDAAAACWEIETMKYLTERVPVRHRLVLEPLAGLRIVHTFLADYDRLLSDEVGRLGPDLVCTQLEGSIDVVQRCAYDGLPVLHFVRDTFYAPNFHVLADLPARVSPTACVANSQYTAAFLTKELRVTAEVLYPIVRLPAARTNRAAAGPEPRVLFMNPHPLKGGDLLLEVARALPYVRFVVLPGWGTGVPERWRALPNVEAHAWPVTEVQQLYASADLVVVPTQESEGFGRVGVEAQLCGVPVLASRHSGLKEVLSDSAALLDDYRNPGAWTAAIKRLLGAPEERGRLVQAGRANAARFSPERIRERFEAIVAGLPSRPADALP